MFPDAGKYSMISPEVDSSSHRTDEGSLQHCCSHWVGEEDGGGVQGLWGEEIIMNYPMFKIRVRSYASI